MARPPARSNQTTYGVKDLLVTALKHQPAMIDALAEFVKVESPSEDKSAVDACVELVEKRASALGGRARRHRQKAFGDLLEVRFGPISRTAKPVMLLGHLDTVWPMGTLAKIPFRIKDGRAFGPGVYDMKAGVVMALAAIEILQQHQLLKRPVVLLLNSDEEVGSTVSRPVTEKIARECEAVFVLEPAQGPQGAYKTARKGVGEFRLQVTGVAAHSGVDFEKGHSAVTELARLIGKVTDFTDLKRGITVNPGVIGGGTRSNVVAAEAWAEVDIRVAKAADAPRLEKRFLSLRPTDRRCILSIAGGLNRPPMERTAGTVALFKRAATLAAEVGLTLQEAATGGGSDGNFTSALGVPTLDGMGAVGEGAHAVHEQIVLSHLAPRTALLAAMVAGLG